jgi:hypothetical protein
MDNEEFQSSHTSDLLMDALTNYGIVSIKNLPGRYIDSKNKALAYLNACALESSATQEHAFPDGTVRLTMATRTVPGPGGQQEVKHGVSSESLACDDFSDASDMLRGSVSQAVRAFSARLSSVLNSASSTPLLSTKNHEHVFETFEDVVEYGEHLEHFHSYRHSETATAEKRSIDTIEMHTDQGVFIAFVPALMVDTSSTEEAAETISQSSKGHFYIQLKDGSRALVNFNENDLVIMLGDGVNQIINPIIAPSGVSLRATPHALDMESNSSGSNRARVWYGRMVLPPFDAIHPKHDDLTFGRLREKMIDASLSSNPSTDDDKALEMGCSRHDAMARQLEDVTCAAGSTYCWHRCMVHEEYSVSDTLCAESSLRVQCINPRGQVYESGHGDYFLACSNSTEPVTPFPTLNNYPQDENKCNEKAWEEFSGSEGYEFVFDKLGDNRGERTYTMDKGGNVTKLMWNVDGDIIDGKIVFNGLFGYLAIGFQNPGGRLNGMYGASIILALPGDGYSAATGLDTSMEHTVNEYVISNDASAFRHWSEPVAGRDLSRYHVSTTDCFTALTFKTDNINDIKFNTSGIDALLWAGNGQNSFVEYHGRGQDGGAGDRDAFFIEWKTGKAWFPGTTAVDNDQGETQNPALLSLAKNILNDEGETQNPDSSSLVRNSLTAFIASVGAMIFGMM